MSDTNEEPRDIETEDDSENELDGNGVLNINQAYHNAGFHSEDEIDIESENENEDNEVQIEVIEESDKDDDDLAEREENEINGNAEDGATLPSTHSYLGENMEELSGRTIHEDDEVLLMPLFVLPGVVLVPGQILPLNLFHPQPISMIKKVIAYDKTFGLMFERSDSLDGGIDADTTHLTTIGVTCEIFSVKEDIFGGITNMSIKAEGRQRFRIIEKKVQLDGTIMGKVKILPEVDMRPCPRTTLLYTQYLHRNAVQAQCVSNAFHLQNSKWKPTQSRFMIGFNKKHINTLCTSMTPYPGWVYKLYNPHFLMDCLLNEIRSWNQNIDLESLPRDPLSFSHWITSNLPLTNDMKIELLEIDSPFQRLRRQIEIMNKCGTTLVCSQCAAIIADKNDLFCLSKRGLMGAYVNPGGHVHETVTFQKAQNITLEGRSSEEYSWFPGYAWTIARCDYCGNHLGWKFTAAKKKMNPRKFWGLTRASLRPVFKEGRGLNDCETCRKAKLRKDSNQPLNHEERPPIVQDIISPTQYDSNI